MDYIKAFIIGGIICALTQILLDRTKLMPGRIMVLLVCSGAVLGAIGIYQHSRILPELVRAYHCVGLGTSLERGPRGCRSGRIHRSVPRRIQSQCSRYKRSINIRISRIIDIQSQNEEINLKKYFIISTGSISFLCFNERM